MKWATRKGAHFTRPACTWLIRKFVDPDAEFFFFDGAVLVEEARRLGAKSFYGKDVGDYPTTSEKSAFTAIMDRHELWGRDRGLDGVARVVGRNGGPAELQQKAVIKDLVNGYCAYITDDHARLRAMEPMWEALYQWYRLETAPPPHD